MSSYEYLPEELVASVRELDFEFDFYADDYDPWAFSSDDILDALVPSIFVHDAEADGPVTVGRSKVGGAPDLPASFDWPRCHGWAEPGEDGPPLAFIAQVNLEECAPYDVADKLPDSGMLYLFCIPDGDAAYGSELDGSGGNVQFFYVDSQELERREPPAGLEEPVGNGGCFEETALAFETGYVVDHPAMALDIRGTVERMIDEVHSSDGFQFMLGSPFIFDEITRDFIGDDRLLLGIPAYDFGLDIFGECEMFVTLTPQNLAEGHLDRADVLVLPGT